jgi:hypothetical protein
MCSFWRRRVSTEYRNDLQRDLVEEMKQPPVTRPTVCIISFSPIARDARVLRQIAALAPQYNLLVLGYGPPPRWRDAASVRWFAVEPPRWYEMQHLKGFLLAGRALRSTVCYEFWYWLQRLHRQTCDFGYAERLGCNRRTVYAGTTC